MTEAVKAKQAERLQIREDTLAGRVPKRPFIVGNYTLDMCCGYAGVDLVRAQYDMDLQYKAFAAVCRDFYADSYPCENMRFAGAYQIAGAKNWVMSSTGNIQHPEIETMYPEDYEDFIADPYGTVVERFLPRVCEHFDAPAPRQALTLAKFIDSWEWYKDHNSRHAAALTDELGYAPEFIKGRLAAAPFDFLADQLRGFKAILMDCRRIPDKVEQAVEGCYQLMLKAALPSDSKPGDINLMPLHLAPYMNQKTFERLYWPSMEKLIVECDKQGVGYNLFAEQDWTRYADFLAKLPSTTVVRFEDGDMKTLKDTVGKNHVIAGFFDATITLTRSTEECIDEAKRIFDICGEGGRYYFCLNKGIMDINSIDVKKYQAVLDWVHTKAVY